MGSLMAGWDSPVQDPKAVMYRRNKSLTRVEIDAYWKSKKDSEEDHLSAICGPHKDEENVYKGSGGRLQRTSSLPLPDRRETALNSGSKPDAGESNKTSCWWTRSNWAFLNEPPVTAMEGPSYKYASQYHVTKFGNLETVNNSKIST